MSADREDQSRLSTCIPSLQFKGVIDPITLQPCHNKAVVEILLPPHVVASSLHLLTLLMLAS